MLENLWYFIKNFFIIHHKPKHISFGGSGGYDEINWNRIILFFILFLYGIGLIYLLFFKN
jgi:hypothetical protein